ncbi:carbohydrate ABC transporter permease [Curtobacterium sp. SP.BCo]|uniref:carbohydrate ABC transporter permease n=1 Tax=Curtobacterium sp. SP.BCo TaxID=3435229 RepID=UPI003F737C51
MTIHTEEPDTAATPVATGPARTQRASGRGAPAGDRPRGLRRTDGAWPWLFVLPLLIGVGTFYIWPIIQTFWYSFTTWGVFGGATFSGVANYVRLVSDPQLYQSLLNTVVYTVIVLLGIPVAVWLASLLNTPGLRFAQFYRVLFFLPYVAMPAAIALVWRIMFNGDYGIVNWFLGRFGVDGPYWISTPGFALVAVSLVGLWSSLGFSMIILGAGLKDIPPELYEAAELDGASRWRQFRSVTVPLLSPSIFFVLIVTTISSFQLFDLLYAILGSTNPVIPKTMSLVFYFYSAGFIDNDKGFAAAIAMVIFVLIGIVTLVQFRVQKKWVQA